MPLSSPPAMTGGRSRPGRMPTPPGPDDTPPSASGGAAARELAEVVVSVGLAQNPAALRALATEGIQRGHMGLHARQVAIAAGAAGDQVDLVAARVGAGKGGRTDRAEAP